MKNGGKNKSVVFICSVYKHINTVSQPVVGPLHLRI